MKQLIGTLGHKGTRLAARLHALNQNGVDLIFTYAGLASTFLTIAEITADIETRQRNVHNARRTFASIQRLRARYSLTVFQKETLNSRLDALRSRLQAFENRF